MRWILFWGIGVLVWVVACTSSAPSQPKDAPPLQKGHLKPMAPVAVTLTSRPVGPYLEVTLSATASAQVPALELELAVPAGARIARGVSRARFGPTAAGASRVLVVELALAQGGGGDLTGNVRVDMGGGRWRSRGAVHRLGAPAAVAAPASVRLIQLPTGDTIAEVRP